MARYIDAEKLEVEGWSASRTYQQDAHTMVYETKKMTDFPAADVVERKKGKFIGTEYDGYADGNPVYYEWKCSECGCVFEEEPTYHYCPNCGARMEIDDGKIY